MDRQASTIYWITGFNIKTNLEFKIYCCIKSKSYDGYFIDSFRVIILTWGTAEEEDGEDDGLDTDLLDFSFFLFCSSSSWRAR